MADPMQLSIPPVFRRALALVETMPEPQFRTFLSTLTECRPSLGSSDLGEQLSRITPDISASNFAGVIEFAVSTRALIASFETNLDVVSEAVTQAYLATDKKSDDPNRGVQIGERVRALLGHDFVALREKSRSLASEFSSTLRGSRCLVDMRPVFSKDGQTGQLEGAIVVATLRLDTSGSIDSPLHMRVDLESLKSLKSTVDRALEKFGFMQEFVKKSELRDLTPEAD